MADKTQFFLDLAEQTCKTRYPSGTPGDNSMRCACKAALLHVLNPVLNQGDNSFTQKYGLTGESPSENTIVSQGNCPFDKVGIKQWDFFTVPVVFK